MGYFYIILYNFLKKHSLQYISIRIFSGFIFIPPNRKKNNVNELIKNLHSIIEFFDSCSKISVILTPSPLNTIFFYIFNGFFAFYDTKDKDLVRLLSILIKSNSSTVIVKFHFIFITIYDNKSIQMRYLVKK